MSTSTALQKLNPAPVALNGPASWDRVKYYADLAAKFSHASIAAQVMAGFDLLELRKQHGVKPGRRTDLSDAPSQSTSPSDLERLNWEDLVKQVCGVSDECARTWMKMAEGIRSKWKKLAPQDRIKQLMSVPPSDWTEKDTILIQGALKKAADGATQTEFLRELGLAKKAPGNPNAKGGEKKKLTMSEEAELRKRQATEDWAAIYRMACVYRDKFVLLPDADVEAQIATLEEALNARKAWLKNPVGKREPKAIAEIFKTK